MRLTGRSIVVFLWLALLWLAPLRAEVIDRVLAVVSGTPITLSDVTAAIQLGLVTAPQGEDPIRSVLSTLIDRELQLAEVDRYAPPAPPQADVERELDAVRARFSSPAAFEAVLARSGMDVPQLRQTLRENLSIRAYLDQRFSSRQDEREDVVGQWIASLRRRAEIVDLYARQPSPSARPAER